MQNAGVKSSCHTQLDTMCYNTYLESRNPDPWTSTMKPGLEKIIEEVMFVQSLHVVIAAALFVLPKVSKGTTLLTEPKKKCLDDTALEAAAADTAAEHEQACNEARCTACSRSCS